MMTVPAAGLRPAPANPPPAAPNHSAPPSAVHVDAPLGSLAAEPAPSVPPAAAWPFPWRSFGGQVLAWSGVAAPLLAPLFWPRRPRATLGVMGAIHAALCYGTLRPNSQWFGPVVTGFNPTGDEVWLTFDDGPDPVDTPRLLDLLDAAGARATFFVRGDRARTYPHLVAEIVRRGHDLGNHTYSHPQGSFWCLPPWSIAQEMDGANATLRALTGHTPRLFRAPVGMVNPFVHPAAAARGLRVVGWSARGFDGVISPATRPETVTARILQDLRPGGIALLHEGRTGARGERVNVETAERLLQSLATRGWRAVVPSEASLR